MGTLKKLLKDFTFLLSSGFTVILVGFYFLIGIVDVRSPGDGFPLIVWGVIFVAIIIYRWRKLS